MSRDGCVLRWSATVTALLVLACSDARETPTSPDFGKVGADCQLGCVEPDPDTAGTPGLFLGKGVTDVVCFNGTQTDTDQDGLSDFCEKNLAVAFAPQLAMTKGSDNLGREPKYAARRLGTTLKARIMYLLSYYVDRGPTTSWCNNNVGDLFSEPGWRKACEGHDGDSEWLTLDVYYNRNTARWYLDYAMYSAHEGFNRYPRGSAAYPPMVYPGNKGGYPRAYVAYQKHANYATDAQCDAGAILGTDECNADTFERVFAGQNIGSRAVHTAGQDCWPSTSPIYSQYGISECYWKLDPFTGWHVGYAGQDSEYSPKLLDMGF